MGSVSIRVCVGLCWLFQFAVPGVRLGLCEPIATGPEWTWFLDADQSYFETLLIEHVGFVGKAFVDSFIGSFQGSLQGPFMGSFKGSF